MKRQKIFTNYVIATSSCMKGVLAALVTAKMETEKKVEILRRKLTARLRLLTELIEEIKAVCGYGFIMSIRFGSSDLGEVVKIAEAIEMAGGDILDVSTGMFGYGRY